MLKEEIKNINLDKNELKKFGLTVGGVFIALGLFLHFYSGINFGRYLTGFGALLFLFGITFPMALKYAYKSWMSLALVMGFFMSRLILSILFYIVVTPIGIIAKIARKDFLDLKFDKSKKSYWNYRSNEDYQKIFTERQF